MPERQDPPGYAITYTDGGKAIVTRLNDGQRIGGEYATRDAAVDAAEADYNERLATP